MGNFHFLPPKWKWRWFCRILRWFNFPQVYRTLEIGTYEKSLGVWTWKAFSLLQLNDGNFEFAVNISNEFDWLSIFRDTWSLLRTGCNASLTNWKDHGFAYGAERVKVVQCVKIRLIYKLKYWYNVRLYPNFELWIYNKRLLGTFWKATMSR